MLSKTNEIFHTSRSVIIALIKQLAEIKLITKNNQQVTTCNGKMSLIDNMYGILKTIKNKIRKSTKIVNLRQ